MDLADLGDGIEEKYCGFIYTSQGRTRNGQYRYLTRMRARNGSGCVKEHVLGYIVTRTLGVPFSLDGGKWVVEGYEQVRWDSMDAAAKFLTRKLQTYAQTRRV